MYKYFLQDNLNKTFVKKNSRIVNANLVVLFDMEKARKMCDFFSRFIFCTFMKKTHEKKIVNKLQKPHPKKLFAPYLAFLHVGEGVLLFRFIHTLHTHTALVGFFFRSIIIIYLCAIVGSGSCCIIAPTFIHECILLSTKTQLRHTIVIHHTHPS